MFSQPVLEDIAEVLEVEVSDLGPDFEIRECDSWDSLTELSLLTLMEEQFRIVMSGEDLARVDTIAQLESAIANFKS